MVHKDKNKYNTCKHNNAVNNFNTAKNQCQYTLVFLDFLAFNSYFKTFKYHRIKKLITIKGSPSESNKFPGIFIKPHWNFNIKQAADFYKAFFQPVLICACVVIDFICFFVKDNCSLYQLSCHSHFYYILNQVRFIFGKLTVNGL